MGGMAGVGVAPPPNHPPTSLAGGSTRARHPGPSIARARCGGSAILGAFRCRSPPSHPTFTPDNPLQTAPSSSPGTTMLGQSPLTRAHCGGGGARSLDRARGVWRLRWRWRAVTSPVTRVTRAARHARVRVRHHRASRASSPFSVPPAHDRHARAAAAAALARSLARAEAEAEAVGLGVAFSYTAHHARHARHTRARACHHRASHASSQPPFPDVTHARARQRWRRCLVCSLPRARGGGGIRSFERRACLARHARARVRHRRHGTC